MNAKMPELKRCFEAAGFSAVKTLLSSGNLVFTSSARRLTALERQAEAAMEQRLQRRFLTIVRPLEALSALLSSDPFEALGVPPEEKRVVTFLQKPPRSLPGLPIELDGARLLVVRGSEVFTAYVRSPRGPVFMRLIERTFGEALTTRTWETVRKVAGG